MFKVGDKVRIINYTNIITGIREGSYIGRIGTIIDMCPNTIVIDIPDIHGYFPTTVLFYDEVELVKENLSFEIGDMVKVKRADFNLAIVGKIGTVIAKNEEGDKYTVTLDDITDCPVGARYKKYYLYENEIELIREFKVGDKVRIIKDDIDKNKYLGYEGTILDLVGPFIHLDLILPTGMSRITGWSAWFAEELELID